MNITPLVDVLLVLLVIFMLAAPAALHRLQVANAPPCTVCPQAPDSIRLAIKRTGEIYWDGTAANRLELRRRLAALAQVTRPAALEILLEATARYALLTDVLAEARNADVRRISVATAR